MNTKSLELLAFHNFSLAFTLLLKIKELLQRYPGRVDEATSLDAFNNLASCYMKFDHITMALRTLEESLKYIYTNKIAWGTAYTYLNLCSVYSALKKHNKAFEYGQLCIEQLEKEISLIDTENEDLTAFKSQFVERIRLLTIAYYSIAVECMKMSLYELCSKYTDRALICLKNFLTSDCNSHQLENK
jgi:tetratricopeptide (TPR) repeat protein